MSDEHDSEPRNRGALADFKDAKGRFVKGNPGRIKGTRTRVTRAVEDLLDGQAEALTTAAIERALGGDNVALRLCLERIAPVRKDSPIRVSLPKVESVEDLVKASSAILDAAAQGEITPSEAQAIGALLDGHARAIELNDLAERVRRLEGGAQ